MREINRSTPNPSFVYHIGQWIESGPEIQLSSMILVLASNSNYPSSSLEITNFIFLNCKLHSYPAKNFIYCLNKQISFYRCSKINPIICDALHLVFFNTMLLILLTIFYFISQIPYIKPLRWQ